MMPRSALCSLILSLAFLPRPLFGGEPPLLDRYGDPLPPRAIARMGTARLRIDQKNRAFAFWPDDETLAVCGVDGVVRLWARTTGREVRRLQTPLHSVDSAAFVPETKAIALIDRKGKWLLWDTVSAKTVWSGSLSDYDPFRGFLVASPDGKLLAVAENEKKVGLYEAASGRNVRSLELHKVERLVFSPDSASLAIAAEKPHFQLWDTRSGKKIRDLPGPNHLFLGNAIVFSHDGKKIAVANGSDAVVSDSAGKEVSRLSFDYLIKRGGVFFTADGKTLLSLGLFGFAQFWDAATGKKRFSRQIAGVIEEGPVLSRDGKVLAVAELRGREFRLIHFLDPATGKDVGPRIDGHVSELNFVAFSLDGKTLLSSGRQMIREWKTETGEPSRLIHRRLIGDDAPIVSADRKLLAEVLPNRVDIWEMGRDEPIRSLDYKGKDYIRAAVFWPDGKCLLSAHNRCYPSQSSLRKTEGQDGLHFWDLATGKEIRSTITAAKDLYSQLIITPDGRTAIAGSVKGTVWREKTSSGTSTDSGAGQLYLWDLPSGRAIRTLEGHREAIHSLALSGDGKLLASTSHDHTVRLWELASGQTLLTLTMAETSNPVAALSPDGRLLAIGDESSLRIYSPTTGKPVLELRGHNGEARCLAFSPDNRRLASGLWDGTALVWDVSAACRAVQPEPRRLNAKELEALWSDLAETDAAKAYRAVGTLVAGGNSAIGMLKDRLHPAESVEPKRLQKLLADLDSDQFTVREAAMKQLANLGERAEPALNAALKERPSLEARKRIEELLKRSQRREWSPTQLRALRTLRALEQIGSAEAREVLRLLAKGSAEAWLTQQAKAALNRLSEPRP